jgi:ferredoxin
MTHIITSLCLRDAGCVEVCPVECIVPGKPVEQWPFEAIFTEDEVPSAYEAKGGEQISMPAGTAGFDESYDGSNHHKEPVHLDHVRTLTAGEVVDLTPDIKPNYDYFQKGPGYKALD